LTIKERYYASLVCRNWYRAFKLPYVWSTFTLADTTLIRGKYNYYSGWQFVLDHMRTSACLNKVGKHFKCLIFEPMMNFYNLYEFMNMISWYSERQESNNSSVINIGTNIRRLKFTFPCNMASEDNPDAIKLFGTGGKLLEALKRLMKSLDNMKCLELIDLMLDSKEAIHLMDDICSNSTQTLLKLVLINATRFPCPLLHIGVFLNLHVSIFIVYI
jgi:F-box protein 39